MLLFSRRLSLRLARLPGALHRHRGQGRMVLIVLLSALLLSGCVLTGVFQSGWAAGVALAALLGLAACSSSSGGGGGGGGGGGDDDDEAIEWPAAVNLGDLSASTGFILVGATDVSRFGYSVSVGPDINGDGENDLVIGAPYADLPGGDASGGAAFIVLGGDSVGTRLFSGDTASTITDLSSDDSIALAGAEDAFLGTSVAAAGDVNDDGTGDVIVGAPDIENGRGAAWVLFGDSSLGDRAVSFGCECEYDSLDISEARRLTVTANYGETTYHFTGQSVATGDFDGDGIPDILVGSPRTDNTDVELGRSLPRATIVFGADPIPHNESGVVLIQAGELSGGDGATFGGTTGDTASALADSYFGESVTAGDIDGDGKDDIIVGTLNGLSYESDTYSGAAVLFGSASLSVTTDPNEMGSSEGFRVIADDGGEDGGLGDSIAFLGDINNDGKGDFAVVSDDGVGETGGRAYIVFGRSQADSSNLVLSSAMDGERGFVIESGHWNVAPRLAGGDLNGDGINDIVLISDYTEGGQTRAATVIFGASDVGSSGLINLDSFAPNGTNGFAVDFPDTRTTQMVSVAVGDINGDGANDIVMGAIFDGGYSDYGAVYVIFGLKPGESFP